MFALPTIARAARSLAAPVVTGSFVIASAAHAELPTAVTTAITTAGTDMVTAITAVITAFVGFWGLKKLGSKLGWV